MQRTPGEMDVGQELTLWGIEEGSPKWDAVRSLGCRSGSLLVNGWLGGRSEVHPWRPVFCLVIWGSFTPGQTASPGPPSPCPC